MAVSGSAPVLPLVMSPAVVADEIIPLDLPIEPRPRLCLCRIEEVPLKGKGLIATKTLSAGQVIVREPPFIRFTHPIDPVALREVYRQLPPKKRELYRSFSNTAPNIVDRIVGIAETNVIPLSAGEPAQTNAHAHDDHDHDHATSAGTEPGTSGPIIETPSGMFEMICRVDHSCAPNAIWRWNGRKREMSESPEAAARPPD